VSIARHDYRRSLTRTAGELALWNWREDSDYDQSDHCDFSDDSTIEHASMIGTALKALGLSDKPRSEGGDNMCYNIEHIDPDSMEDAEDQEYVVNGVTYYSTTASHAFAINQVGGGKSFAFSFPLTNS
jgi:hypothetical protein